MGGCGGWGCGVGGGFVTAHIHVLSLLFGHLRRGGGVYIYISTFLSLSRGLALAPGDYILIFSTVLFIGDGMDGWICLQKGFSTSENDLGCDLYLEV